MTGPASLTEDGRQTPQSAATAARRRPLQRRSAATCARIEAAASRLLQRGMKLEAITTPEIAREAGVSIGALYRFFPDKQAIVDAIAVRRVSDFEATLVASLTREPAFRTGAALISFIMDRFESYSESYPDFRTILYGGNHISQGIRQRYFGSDSEIASLARKYAVQVLGLPDTPDFALRWRLVGEITTPLLQFAANQAAPADRKRVFQETKRLIATYLFGEDDYRRAEPRLMPAGRRRKDK